MFKAEPDVQVLSALSAVRKSEKVALLAIDEDAGFLANTFFTDVTADRKFLSFPFSEKPGVFAWAKGTLIDFTEDTSRIPDLMEHARRFAFPPPRG